MVKTFIHINQHIIRANLKHDKDDPAVTIKRGKTNTYCRRARIHGPCDIIHSRGCDEPLLPCGARVVLVTESEVEVLE